MSYFGVFPLDEYNAFLYTVGATSAVAFSIMALRFLNLCSSSLSRKLLHILMAPVFILCWPLFPNNEKAMYYAMSIPFAFTAVFWLVGSGVIPCDVIVKSMSRSGNRSELKVGPVHYGLIMTLVTWFFWKKEDAIFTIMTLSFGDGFAALLGCISSCNRRLGWNASKSWLGLIGYIVFSTLGIAGVCWYFKECRENLMYIRDKYYIENAVIVSVVCGVMETLTIHNYDNVTITVVAILTYYYVK